MGVNFIVVVVVVVVVAVIAISVAILFLLAGYLDTHSKHLEVRHCHGQGAD